MSANAKPRPHPPIDWLGTGNRYHSRGKENPYVAAARKEGRRQGIAFYFKIKTHRETKCVKEEIGTGRRIRKPGRGKAVIAST